MIGDKQQPEALLIILQRWLLNHRQPWACDRTFRQAGVVITRDNRHTKSLRMSVRVRRLEL